MYDSSSSTSATPTMHQVRVDGSIYNGERHSGPRNVRTVKWKWTREYVKNVNKVAASFTNFTQSVEGAYVCVGVMVYVCLCVSKRTYMRWVSCWWV